MKLYNKIIYIITLCLLAACFGFGCVAADAEEAARLMENETGRVVSISHRGDTVFYPANSIEAIMSAKDKGADAVSVAVSKTKDGEYVLAENISLGNICNSDYEAVGEITLEELQSCNLYDSYGILTEYKAVSLKEALTELEGSVYLILDIEWEDRDGVYAIIRDCGAFSFAAVRVKASASEIADWADENIAVIGIYTGNIIWNSISHINKLSEKGMPLVEYRTKNYFNVCYGSWVSDNFSSEGKARAVAAAYDEDLCGKRNDSESGWDELIKSGFTVIETNNIDALVSYIENNEKQRESLAELLGKVKAMDTSEYSAVSRDNLADAVENAEAVLEGRAKSLEEAQNAYSDLIHCLNEKRVSDGQEDTRGALNITVGKVIAAVLIGSIILGAQIFVYKQHKKKKT